MLHSVFLTLYNLIVLMEKTPPKEHTKKTTVNKQHHTIFSLLLVELTLINTCAFE